MQHLIGLVLLLVAIGWWMADSDWGVRPAPAGAAESGPQWRRTSAGWIKVGGAGALSLNRPAPGRAPEPSLHPGVVTVFMLLAGVLSLSLFDAAPRQSAADPKSPNGLFMRHSRRDKRSACR